MATCFGSVFVFAVIIGGIYLYFRVARLNQEIMNKSAGTLSEENEDE